MSPLQVKPRTRHAWKWAGGTAVLVVGLAAAALSLKHARLAAPGDALKRLGSSPSPFLPTVENKNPPPGPGPEGMVWIPGGEFSMGSTVESEALCGLPGVTGDALPVHRVYVAGFWMDANEVTNEQFEKFARATGYLTIAERTPTKEEFPTAPPENLVAGSVVFTPTPGPVPLDNHYRWWRYQQGANWRHPEGPESMTQSPTPSGRASACRPRRSGNLQPAVASEENFTCGVTNFGLAARSWRTPFKGLFL